MRRFPRSAILLPIALGGVLLCTVGDAFFPPVHAFLRGLAPGYFVDDVTGTVTSTGESGNWTMHPGACYSGQRQQYFGVEFYDHAQPTLGGQIVLTPGVTREISMNEGLGKQGSVFWTEAMCTVWDVDVQRTNTFYNRITAVRGHARFDCQDEDSHVSGNLTFNNCH